MKIKKNNFLLLLSLILFLALLSSGCKKLEERKIEENAKQSDRSPVKDLSEKNLENQASLYEWSGSLIDQDEKKVSLSVFQGHPVLISMFYTSCGYTCPLLFNQLKQIENKLEDHLRDEVRFLLISFDAENDSPQVLKQMAEKQKINLTRWKLAVGSKNVIQEIAALLNIKYRKAPDGSFNHSALITVLDPNGKMKAQFEVERFAVEEVTQKLKQSERTTK